MLKGEGYCIKCKTARQMDNRFMSRYKNGMPVEKGQCSMCGTSVTRMLSKEEVLVYEVQKPDVTEGDPN